jgi:NhaP-type Na+/H+ or K+/H+ antiporter
LLQTRYISYMAAEVAGGSGILSMFFCGIVLGHYNW